MTNTVLFFCHKGKFLLAYCISDNSSLGRFFAPLFYQSLVTKPNLGIL